MSDEAPLYSTTLDKDDIDAAVKQEFKLFIKASQIDKETRGSCPICQHWFMIAYLIAQKQPGVNFSVFTVQENSPPKEFEGWSKKFPVVLAVNCTSKKGPSMSGQMFDNFEELEFFFENINTHCPELKRHNRENGLAMELVEDVYARFNGYLRGQGPERLQQKLKTLNEELEKSGNIFLIDDMLCYVDCHLLPRLQHIKVAGEKYGNFKIPLEYKGIWRYLAHAYQQPAFMATMPRDQDINFHYDQKVTAFPRCKPTLEKFTYDTTIPKEIEDELMQEVMQQRLNGDTQQHSQDEAAADNGMMDQQQDQY